MEKLWTTTEVAQYLGIGEGEVEQLAQSGQLTGYRLGGKFLRFRPDQVKGLKPQLTMSRAPAAGSAAAERIPRLTRVRDFLYFYDLYLVSFTLLAGLVLYLVSSGG